MNTAKVSYGTTVLAAALTTVFRASADPAAAPAKPDRSYTGTVIAVDPKDRRLDVSEWALSKKSFNLSDNCTYAMLFTTVANNHGTADDLRPGEKVTVSYQDSHGVLIADRIEQQTMRFEGMVAVIDPTKHTLTLHRRGLDKDLAIADSCVVVLRQEKPGTLADLHPGDHVTAMYETPDGKPTAREIAQTSMAFAGTLTAIDLDEKTVKARAVFGTMKFNVADDCTVVVNGRTDGKLSDLKPNEQLLFNYDPINGINVVNRIGPAPDKTHPQSNMTASSPGYPGYPPAQ